MKLTFSEIKEIASLVNDWRSVAENIRDNDPDFEIENYRFIDADEIDHLDGILISDKIMEKTQ